MFGLTTAFIAIVILSIMISLFIKHSLRAQSPKMPIMIMFCIGFLLLLYTGDLDKIPIIGAYGNFILLTFMFVIWILLSRRYRDATMASESVPQSSFQQSPLGMGAPAF